MKLKILILPLLLLLTSCPSPRPTPPAGSVWARLMFGKDRKADSKTKRKYTSASTYDWKSLKMGKREGGERGKSLRGFTSLPPRTYSAGGQSHTVKEYRHNAPGLEFVLVPGWSFQMGSSEWGDSKPIHTVTLKAFLISKTEVTQGVWKKIMGTEPWSGKSYVKEGSDYPATYVSWNMAKKFCKKTALQLPTEAQWEYACRAGTTTKYYWSDSFSSAGDYSWNYYNAYKIGEKYAHQVAQKKPNAFGLYDMAGNVWEWCEDFWHSNYNGAPNDGSSWMLNKSSGNRILRGGSWDGNYDYLIASACRYSIMPGYQSNFLGYRLVAPFRDH